MRNKGLVLFWVDMANAVAFVSVLATGIVLKWVLPHGPRQGGRGPASSVQWLGLDRHEWGEVHLWISIALVTLLGLHLLLHTGWIVASCRKYLLGWVKPLRIARPVRMPPSVAAASADN